MLFWKILIIVNFILLIFLLFKKNKIIDDIRKNNIAEYENLIKECNNIVTANIALIEEKTEHLNKIIFGAEKLIDRFTYIIKTLETVKDSNESMESKIIKLYNFGFQISEISKILDMAQGEIKLILDLKKIK